MDRKWRKPHVYTVEPRYNKPPYKEILGVTNDFLRLRINTIYEKESR